MWLVRFFNIKAAWRGSTPSPKSAGIWECSPRPPTRPADQTLGNAWRGGQDRTERPSVAALPSSLDRFFVRSEGLAIVEILLTEAQIQDQVRRLGREIEADYHGKPLTIVAVLTGSLLSQNALPSPILRKVGRSA